MPNVPRLQITVQSEITLKWFENGNVESLLEGAALDVQRLFQYLVTSGKAVTYLEINEVVKGEAKHVVYGLANAIDPYVSRSGNWIVTLPNRVDERDALLCLKKKGKSVILLQIPRNGQDVYVDLWQDASCLMISVLEVIPAPDSGAIQVNFCMVNNTLKRLFLTNLRLRICQKDQCTPYAITSPGALFQPHIYFISIDPQNGDDVSITQDRFTYAPHEQEDFRLKVTSCESGWKYRVQIVGNIKDIITKQDMTILSEEFDLEFPRRIIGEQTDPL